MLNYYDRPFVYFPPKPNRFILTLGKLYNRYYYLRSHVNLVESVDCEGLKEIKLLASDKKNRLLFISNHPTHSDSQIIMEAFRQMGATSNFMAAYDLFFRQSKFNRWVMQKAGSFSVDREAFNSESIKEAVNTLLTGKYHLTIFSEGRPYLQNDWITPLQSGASFIAASAQKRLDAKGKGEQIILIPTAIKLTHIQNCRDKVITMINSLYDFLNITPNPKLKIEESIEELAIALMEYGLKSLGFPASKGKSLEKRQQSSGEMIIKSLEKEMSIKPGKGKSLNERASAIRSEIHKVMLNPNNNSKLWAHSRIRSQKIMLALKILSYPLEYLRENPSLDRCSEFVERLIEDKQSKAIPPYSMRKAIVKFGKPFSISEIDSSERQNKNDFFSEITNFSQKSIQDLLDNINLTNSHAGGEMF
ncbi:MAG: 1-acyl-sn-glycerol-3-phosphate acyltransferase [Spirochaetales bacterium]|nr:1-acyl-sn-glycerol-3-phosphate acyltransferase [Spirochaetales bacterium]